MSWPEVEVIDGHGRKAYLKRWELWRHASKDGRAVYLHKYLASDWSTDLHDHPKAFLSIGLWGSYTEETPGRHQNRVSGKITRTYGADERHEVVYRAPWIRRFPAEHAHRLRIPKGKTCWTLVYVGPREREWGFWAFDKWWPWEFYVHSELADRALSDD